MGVNLTESQRIRTSGARAAAAFTVDGRELLAIPQLATDIPGTAPAMNGGDSDTDLLVLQYQDGRYQPFTTLPAPGGEDAEFFTINDRAFLAVASIRTGGGPYKYTTESRIFEWRDGSFHPFQSITTYAAKQWKFWTIDDRHFLGLAQGVRLPHLQDTNRASVVYEWSGSSFAEFQHIPSEWAYNWHPFTIDGTHFVAHAEHLGASTLYRFDGDKYWPHQPLVGRTGRAFATFDRDGDHYLLVAALEEPPLLMRWDDNRFVEVARLAGLGARELEVVERDGRLFVVRVNFILGTPADPHPVMTSQVYEWRDGSLQVVAEFPTCGGTDIAVVEHGDELQLVVTNSLSPELRFANDTVVYTFAPGS